MKHFWSITFTFILICIALMLKINTALLLTLIVGVVYTRVSNIAKKRKEEDQDRFQILFFWTAVLGMLCIIYIPFIQGGPFDSIGRALKTFLWSLGPGTSKLSLAFGCSWVMYLVGTFVVRAKAKRIKKSSWSKRGLAWIAWFVIALFMVTLLVGNPNSYDEFSFIVDQGVLKFATIMSFLLLVYYPVAFKEGEIFNPQQKES